MNKTGFDQTLIKKKNLVKYQTAKIQKMTAF
jgi:proton-coupled amino acid transporter